MGDNMPINIDFIRTNIDRGETMNQMWTGFAQLTMSHVQADSAQYNDMQAAFYSGALCLFNWMMVQMDPGDEPTDADEERMTRMNDEIHNFFKENFEKNLAIRLRRGVTPP